MAMSVYASWSNCGTVGEENEDRWYADPRNGLYIVCDGIGGQPGGGVAAQVAIDLLPGRFLEVLNESASLDDVLSGENLERGVCELSSRIHGAAKADSRLHKMGCTFVAAVVRLPRVLVMNLGDSRAYHVHENTLDRLTTDHSVAQSLVNQGAISGHEARAHPAGNMLTHFIGMKTCPRPASNLVPAVAGDRLLLCTDGLTDAVQDDEITTILSHPSDVIEACQNLVKRAIQKGEKDDITALVVDL